jgi:hypothetical protein
LQELADEINPPGFDPVENADQVRQRGEFTHLCTDLAALPPPAQFIARHDGMLPDDHRGAGREGQPASLGQLGVSKDESAALQRMAAMPEDEFEGHLTTAKQNGRVSRAAVLRDEDAEEHQRARDEFDAFVAPVTPPDYDRTFNNEAVDYVGHLDGVCDDVLELAARLPAEEFAALYPSRPGLKLPM